MHKYKSRSTARYNLEAGISNLAMTFPCKYNVNCLQYDDNKMVCGAGDNLVIFENCFDESVTLSRRIVEGHTGWINDLQFDSSKILTASSDYTVKIWDADEYSCDATIDFSEKVSCVKFYENQIFSYSKGTTLKIHDINTLQCTFTKKFADSCPSTQQMDISSDGRTVVVASSMVHVIDTRTCQTVNVFQSNPHMQTFCHGAANNNLLCVLKEYLSLYDIFTGKSVLDFEGSTNAEVTCMYSNYGILAAGFEHCDVRLWDVKTGNIITDIEQATVLAPQCIKFDEGKLICGSAQTKCNMYTFGSAFEDQVGLTTEMDKARIRKWKNRMQFYK